VPALPPLIGPPAAPVTPAEPPLPFCAPDVPAPPPRPLLLSACVMPLVPLKAFSPEWTFSHVARGIARIDLGLDLHRRIMAARTA
jgi:hypothetical protein